MLVGEVMRLILLPVSQSSPLLLPPSYLAAFKALSPLLLQSSPPSFAPLHSLIKQQAYFLHGQRARGPCFLSFTLSSLSSPLLSSERLPLSFFHPPSVTTALEKMSFHGRFAAISKMDASLNGQLHWS